MKSKVEFIAPAQKGEYEYIGFDLEANAGRFIFPCRYIASGQENAADAGQEKEQKEEAKKIVSLIKRVQKEFSLGGSGDETFQFYSMIWLLRALPSKCFPPPMVLPPSFPQIILV